MRTGGTASPRRFQASPPEPPIGPPSLVAATLDTGAGTITVQFDQYVSPGSISAGNFYARPSAGTRYVNTVFAHGGGSVVGPMSTTTDGGLGSSPTLDFRNVPAGEISNPSTGDAVQELGFPLTVI